jgi:2'-5' RNA ligase
LQTTRAFVAVPIEEAPRRAMARLIQSLQYKTQGVRWIDPANLHLTIAFLGDVPTQDLPEVGRALDDAASGRPAIDLQLRCLGAFPHRSRPRILWIGGGDGSTEVVSLAAQVQGALEPFGFRRDLRPYAVHATIGRVKEGARARGLTEILDAYSDWEAGVSETVEIHLMASVLGPKGPSYSIVSRHPLGVRRGQGAGGASDR